MTSLDRPVELDWPFQKPNITFAVPDMTEVTEAVVLPAPVEAAKMVESESN